MRMQGEDIPKEDGLFDLGKDAPYDRCRALRDSLSFCWSVCLKTPTVRMRCDVDIIGEGKACSSATPIAEISADPDCINFTC